MRNRFLQKILEFALVGALTLSALPLPAAAQTTYIDRFTGSVVATGAKQPVDAATTANIVLSGAQTIDTVAVTDNNRVLVKNQTDQTKNGIYVVVSGGAWYRAGDFNGPSGTVTGQLIYVTGGTQMGMWVITTLNPIQIDQSGGQITSPSNITFGQSIPDITKFGAGVSTWLVTPSSANLAAAMLDLTGSGSLVFANSPTLVTPALGTPASGVMTNVTGTAAGLTAGNATKLATARTINGVSFDGSASITIPSAFATLTGTAVQGDLLYYSGSAWVVLAPGTSGQILSTQGASANPQWINNTPTSAHTYQASPGNPTPQGTLGSFKMLGLGGSLTPATSGTLMVTICGDLQPDNTSGITGSLQIQYGTGGAPSNGASLTGTTIGPTITAKSVTAATYIYPFSSTAIVTGLSTGTAYWFDLASTSSSNGSPLVTNIGLSIQEVH